MASEQARDIVGVLLYILAAVFVVAAIIAIDIPTDDTQVVSKDQALSAIGLGLAGLIIAVITALAIAPGSLTHSHRA